MFGSVRASAALTPPSDSQYSGVALKREGLTLSWAIWEVRSAGVGDVGLAAEVYELLGECAARPGEMGDFGVLVGRRLREFLMREPKLWAALGGASGGGAAGCGGGGGRGGGDVVALGVVLLLSMLSRR